MEPLNVPKMDSRGYSNSLYPNLVQASKHNMIFLKSAHGNQTARRRWRVTHCSAVMLVRNIVLAPIWWSERRCCKCRRPCAATTPHLGYEKRRSGADSVVGEALLQASFTLHHCNASFGIGKASFWRRCCTTTGIPRDTAWRRVVGAVLGDRKDVGPLFRATTSVFGIVKAP